MIGYVIRQRGRYWGTNAITGAPGWTWAPALAAVFESKGRALDFAVEAATGPDPMDDAFEIVPDPTGGKW